MIGRAKQVRRPGITDTGLRLKNHTFIGYDRSELMIREMRAMGLEVDRSFFALRCDNQTVYWQMVRAGCGIGVVPEKIARATPGIERVLPDLALPELPIWLTAHQALRATPRIKRVYDMLAEGLRRATAQASGPV